MRTPNCLMVFAHFKPSGDAMMRDDHAMWPSMVEVGDDRQTHLLGVGSPSSPRRRASSFQEDIPDWTMDVPDRGSGVGSCFW